MSIVGTNVQLRLLEQIDLDKKVKWINDPVVHAYLHYEVPLSSTKTRKWFSDSVKDNSRRDFAIETPGGTCIGNTGLIGINFWHRTAEFYILIGNKEYWGKGLGTEAGTLLIRWAFKWLDLHKIWATADKGNLGSIKMLERIGFKHEATMRQEKSSKEKWVDVIRMGLLRNEFESMPA